MSLYLIILLLCLLCLWQQIKINATVFLIIQRGILAPNKFWWNISDTLLRDGSGIELYNSLKSRHTGQSLVPVNFFGYQLQLVTDVGVIREILDHSPNIFGVGTLKYNFFKSFMPLNVGVSNEPSWSPRRKFNDSVLDNPLSLPTIQEQIRQIVTNNTLVPRHYDAFDHLAKKTVMKIVFGADYHSDELFQVFHQANSSRVFTGGVNLSQTDSYKRFRHYVMRYIKKNQLSSHQLSDEEVYNQVPHWMFPIVGTISTTLPRILLLLYYHPTVKCRLLAELRLGQTEYLRQCILETLRLNNPVVTTFRRSLVDYRFNNGVVLPAGTELLILNNPILRDPNGFSEPNRFIPERWNDTALESSYYAIMFNQGPQKCPGKNLALFILQRYIIELYQSGKLEQILSSSGVTPHIDVNNVAQMINPFAINF